MSDISSMLSVQAYERLVTFADRSGFPALVSRFPAGNLSANQLVEVLKQAITQEFEHNLSQQIYVEENAWQAVVDMKEQQCFILEQLVATLPSDASGDQLVDAIKTFLAADANASIQPIVLELLKTAARNNLSRL
jgi:hypothetical protein